MGGFSSDGSDGPPQAIKLALAIAKLSVNAVKQVRLDTASTLESERYRAEKIISSSHKLGNLRLAGCRIGARPILLFPDPIARQHRTNCSAHREWHIGNGCNSPFLVFVYGPR
jgi:hypothetical protein